uniref:CCHC-type domain-containing protein n=1 Tax=Romanomermis culicivorax TaxID=13658 RepID=A0A915KUB1_ROMCU
MASVKDSEKELKYIKSLLGLAFDKSDQPRHENLQPRSSVFKRIPIEHVPMNNGPQCHACTEYGHIARYCQVQCQLCKGFGHHLDPCKYCPIRTQETTKPLPVAKDSQ